MDTEQLRGYLDNPTEAKPWLQAMCLHDLERAHRNLVSIAQAGVPLDLLATMCDQLIEQLPLSSDADMSLNNLDRFVAASRSPLALGALFERDKRSLPILLCMFSTSQYLAEQLIADNSSYDLLRITEGSPASREMLCEELCNEVAALPDDDELILMALRRFKRRETLRISYGDIICEQRIEVVTRQISHLADAILEAATLVARRRLEAKWGVPRTPSGERAKFVILALGKLGGEELNYSSDIDLMYLFDQQGKTDGVHHIANSEFFERLGGEITRMVSETTPLGVAYRVDLRLRPNGGTAPVAISLDAALRYYDIKGRTWERQAFVKCRPAAGDLPLGEYFLAQLQPWIWLRYLNLADITGIKALKRRIEHRTHRKGEHQLDVKTGHGGIRDIEFAVQFLQLLNGGDLSQVRTGNTLEALQCLEQVGCLTSQEAGLLGENYAFLRKIEHRLQIMFDLQTHALPNSKEEMVRLAIRMGYAPSDPMQARREFESEYKRVTELNRKMLDHLLHDAFGDDNTEPEVDLVLDPDPSQEFIDQVLSKYGFRDIPQSYRFLMMLSEEKIRFLSTRRCRHFLASIAPRLLAAIATTPNPDQTLVNLSQVSDSLGGKGALWELFSFSPPTLKMYVELCTSSPYLCGILTSNPGMIDELLDSLLLDRLPTASQLEENLRELCRAAEDLEPILHSFKNAKQLDVGVRDILGKEDVESTTGALSDIAQSCLDQVAQREWDKLCQKLGVPTVGDNPNRSAELIILAMGKFGGHELNYYSDLDVVFLYDEDGHTVHRHRSRKNNSTTNQHFFSELAQRIIKTCSQICPQGRLYEIDARLRPSGRGGVLATSLAEFRHYFASGTGQLWERQALCKARCVFGSSEVTAAAMEAVQIAAFKPPWREENVAEILQMRKRLQETAGPADLKRGPGGIVDIEFVVQMLQLKYGSQYPSVRQSSTLEALAALGDTNCLEMDDCRFFSESYRFLRRIEARLRLMYSNARDKLPEAPDEIDKLAHSLGYQNNEKFLSECQEYTEQTRYRFLKLFE